MIDRIDLRATLRALPVLTGSAPEFDLDAAPADPVDLFVRWLDVALDADVPEPHAMTLATVDASGQPDARVLILKDVDSAGWHFGISGASAKGVELADRPVAALTFYWQPLARQVRVRGPVVADPIEVTREDFLARPLGSRAMALTRRQSTPFHSAAELDEALSKAQAELEHDPDIVPDEWVSYAVAPKSVEFWQGDPERRHKRLSYVRDGDRWARTVLWP